MPSALGHSVEGGRQGYLRKKNNMYELYDTFNDHLISKHRTLAGAVRAQSKHLRSLRRREGSGSYVTYSIGHDGKAVCENEIMAAEQEVAQ